MLIPEQCSQLEGYHIFLTPSYNNAILNESRFPGAGSIVVACVAMLANALIGCIFMFLYVSSAEIYPTTMRVTALGLCSGLARIGGALAPFVALLVS